MMRRRLRRPQLPPRVQTAQRPVEADPGIRTADRKRDFSKRHRYAETTRFEVRPFQGPVRQEPALPVIIAAGFDVGSFDGRAVAADHLLIYRRTGEMLDIDPYVASVSQCAGDEAGTVRKIEAKGR